MFIEFQESEQDAERRRQRWEEEQAKRDQDARAAKEARERAEANRLAAEQAHMERELREQFPGTDCQWEAEKDDLLKAERARITMQRAEAARTQFAEHYRDMDAKPRG